MDFINASKLLQDYFKFNPIHRCQTESFNYFIDHIIPYLFVNSEIVSNSFTLKITDAWLENPTICDINSTEVDITYEECITRLLTFSSKLMIKGKLTINDINDINIVDIETFIGRIPVMVGSKLCPNADTKGFFVISGCRKVINMEERIAYNTPFLLTHKKDLKFTYYVEFKSMDRLMRSSFVEIGIKAISKNILIYCPELTLSLIPFGLFIRLFLTTQEIINCFDFIKYELPVWQVQEFLIETFTPYFHLSELEIISMISNKFQIDKNILKIKLREKMLIHMNIQFDQKLTLREKGLFFMFLCRTLIAGSLGKVKEFDKDHYGDKRVYSVCHFLTAQLYHSFTKFKISISNVIKKGTFIHINEICDLLSKQPVITNSMKMCLSSNNWHGKNQQQYMSQAFDPYNRNMYRSLLRKIVTPVNNKTSKVVKQRDMHLTQTNILCPYETPDGEKVGLVKYLSTGAYLTIDCSEGCTTIVKRIIKIHKLSCGLELTENNTLVLVNGSWIDSIREPILLIKYLENSRSSGLLPFEATLFYDSDLRAILIYCDAGRILYPYLTVNNPKSLTIMDGIRSGEIIFSDKLEDEMRIITEKDIFNNCNNFKELFIFLGLGYNGIQIPFSNFNQAPRNIYQCQMSKHAMGTISSDMIVSTHINSLWYAQSPIVMTLPQTLKFMYEFPTGTNAVMAMMCFHGQNQEDSLVLNKSSVERGFMISDRIGIITYVLESASDIYRQNISYLDSEGIVKVKTIVKKGDIIISVRRAGNDISEKYTGNKPVQIIKVIKVKNDKAEQIIHLYWSQTNIPQIGDKFASRFGQKATVGMIYTQENLPFDENGIQPDIILNPLCIPSRMTIGHLLEMACGIDIVNKSKVKYCEICVNYKKYLVDNENNHNCLLNETIKNYLYHTSFYNDLIPKHIKEFKNVTMYSGETGAKFQALIYRGLIYVQRLKHLSDDKKYVRTTGPIQQLTRQPREGRSVDGGHRFGLQERDNIVAHGCMFTIRDRLYLSSDPFHIYVCKSCGLQYHGKTNDKYSCCKKCQNMEFVKIRLPYGPKAFCQEIMGLNICPLFIT